MSAVPSAAAAAPAPVADPASAPPGSLESVRQICAEIEMLAASAGHPPAAAPEAVSFGLFPGLLETAPLEAFSRLSAAVTRLLADIRPTATIRTSLGDGESAAAVVTYTGLAAFAWPVNPSADLVVTQLTSVQRVVALRSALARAVAAAGSALAALTAAAANPLALPHVLSTVLSLQSALERLMTAAEAAV